MMMMSSTPIPTMLLLLCFLLPLLLSTSLPVVEGQAEQTNDGTTAETPAASPTTAPSPPIVKSPAVSTTGTLTSFVPPVAYSYRAQILFFEHDDDSLTLPPYHRLSANLIRPPPTRKDVVSDLDLPSPNYDDRLCEYVERSHLSPSPTEYEFAPVTLLVRLGGCTLRRKLQVALDIRSQSISNDTLWSVMFYNEPDPTISDPESTLDVPQHSVIQDLEEELSSLKDDVELDDGIDKLIYASLSYRTGRMLIDQTERTSGRLPAVDVNGPPRPELLSPNNDIWRFPVSLERGSNPYGTGRDIANTNGYGYDDDDEPTFGQLMFIWFRFILFGILACFPCLRFIRLWFGAGGRIRFRRNDNGRIVGLYLQAPTDEDWLHPHGLHLRHDTAAHRNRRRDERQLLTKEQVMELLPEIQYVRPAAAKYAEDEEYYQNDTDTDNDQNCMVDPEMGTVDVSVTDGGEADALDGAENDDDSNDVREDGAFSVSMVDEDGDMDGDTDGDDTTQPIQISYDVDSNDQYDDDLPATIVDPEIQEHDNNISDQEEAVGDAERDQDESSPGEVSKSDCREEQDDEERIFTTSTSTTCSICIDEFEEGELVRLLPRCGHAYHTECILPWLCERQGHCPLCKVSVLSPSQRQALQEEHEAENGEEQGGNDEVHRNINSVGDVSNDEENQSAATARDETETADHQQQQQQR